MIRVYLALLIAFISIFTVVVGHSEVNKVLKSSIMTYNLPGVSIQMRNPGYWIGLHPNPDRLILTATQIKKINKTIIRNLPVTDIATFSSTYSGNKIRKMIKGNFDYLMKTWNIYVNGQPGDSNYFDDAKKILNLEKVSDRVKVKWGVVCKSTDIRAIPSLKGLFNEPEEYFDRIQNSFLDLGTPLAILHTSADGQWFFVISPLVEGWVRTDAVGTCSKTVLKNYLEYKSIVVTISAKADVYLDSALKNYYDTIRMGTQLPLAKKQTSGRIKVMVPTRLSNGALKFVAGYMRASDVNKGHLPYTPRTIIQQAFNLLHFPYGWGGMYGEQDCSGFILRVFATVGIKMPRHSYFQALVGSKFAEFDDETTGQKKSEVIQQKAIAGISLLYKKGHIMLYLGTVNGNPYVIHSTWSYDDTNNQPIIIGRVVVSDLSLGSGSTNKSLLDQIEAGINIVK